MGIYSLLLLKISKNKTKNKQSMYLSTTTILTTTIIIITIMRLRIILSKNREDFCSTTIFLKQKHSSNNNNKLLLMSPIILFLSDLVQKIFTTFRCYSIIFSSIFLQLFLSSLKK